MNIDRKIELLEGIIRMVEETIFTKECEMEFANYQKLVNKEWEDFAKQNEHAIKNLTAKLKFYEMKLEKLKAKTNEDSVATTSGQ